MRAEAEAAPPWTCATPALSPIREHRPMESGMAKQVTVPARARQVAVRSLAALLGGFLATLCLAGLPAAAQSDARSEEHTSELQSLMRISYAVFCLKKTRNSMNDKRYHTL